MKKLLLITLLFTLTFTACGSNKETKKDTGNNGSEPVSDFSVSNYEKSFIGHNSDNSYENFFLNIACDFPEDWTLYNNREILEVNNLDSIPSKDDLEPGIMYTDLIAFSNSDFDSVIITFTQDEEGTEVSTSDYADFKLDDIIDTFELNEYTDINAEVSTIEFLGTECDCVKVNALLDEVSVSTVYVYTIIDGKTVTVQAQSYEEAQITEILSGFSISE